MNISKFFRLSLGVWRSQRTGHNHELSHVEDVQSTLTATPLALDEAQLLKACRDSRIDQYDISSPYRVDQDYQARFTHWQQSHSYLVIPVPNPDNANQGTLIYSYLDLDTPPSQGTYELRPDGTLMVRMVEENAMREERIWFPSANLRLHVSMIRPNDRAVTTTIFTSDVRTSPVSALTDNPAIALQR